MKQEVKISKDQKKVNVKKMIKELELLKDVQLKNERVFSACHEYRSSWGR